MTIILRLEGLDVKAGTEDIRTFFKHLHIPEGGVYILGGTQREAFIGFSTERDAQMAMRLTGKVLKGSNVMLHVSNMAELEQKLKTLLKKKNPSPIQYSAKRPRHSERVNLHVNGTDLSPKTADLPPSTMIPHDLSTANYQQSLYQDTTSNQVPDAPKLDSGTAFLLGICTVLQGLQSTHQRQDETAPITDLTKTDYTDLSGEVMTKEVSLESSPGYVRLFGLPPSTTKNEICQFFRGLVVQEAIVNVKLGLNHACLVKFANMQDANDALLFNQHQLGNNSVEVRRATEKMWAGALEECEGALDIGTMKKRKRSPSGETANHKRKSPPLLQNKNRPFSRLTLKAKRPRLDNLNTLPQTKDCVVKVSKLPTTMTKTEIKELFQCATIPHKNVLHLLDKEGNRTDTAFLIFKRAEDYDYAMALSGCHVGSTPIEVSSISWLKMKEMMAETHPRKNRNHCLKTDADKTTRQRGDFDPTEAQEEPRTKIVGAAAQTCLYVRNMPADVHESHIKSFFRKYKLEKDDIFLLRDIAGESIGEAVVQFRSPKCAALAQRLHGQDFLGSEVLLTLISVKQMEDILGHETAKAEN
ncbi:RNA binding motif protein 12Ba [Xyrichtys novacula]|uniref:RNA binding motif protein 12Ba n=1 Tax=Xyrichtys novacula TaxID=13765 RepID=A0AAV1FMC3_XYRNO|nr:RNA binding motif protein 12Ba [Xyrichtys novacula]